MIRCDRNHDRTGSYTPRLYTYVCTYIVHAAIVVETERSTCRVFRRRNNDVRIFFLFFRPPPTPSELPPSSDRRAYRSVGVHNIIVLLLDQRKENFMSTKCLGKTNK